MAAPGERVVLGWLDPGTFQGFRFSSAAPEGMAWPEQAVEAGAKWEGDELVTYDPPGLRHRFERMADGWTPDSD